MTARHVTIAEAVKDSLNTAAMALSVTATRAYQDWRELEDTDEPISLIVMPQAVTRTIAARRTVWANDFTVQVGFRARVPFENNIHSLEHIDRFMQLAQDICDHLRDAGKMGGATLIAMEHEPIFDPDELDSTHVFMTAPSFVYRCGRTA